MQCSAVLQTLLYYMLAFICLLLLLVTPTSCSLLCFQTNNRSLSSHSISRFYSGTGPNPMSMTAATTAHLSPIVFRGTLLSVLVQRDGTVRAAFGLDKAIKMDSGIPPSVRQLEVVYFQKQSEGGQCIIEVNEQNLRLGKQYVVFGRFQDGVLSSITATAFPIEYETKSFRAIKRVVCKGCAKPPRVEGLRNVRILERKKLQLQCHLSGNPIPWVQWYKDGQPVDGNKRIKVRTRRRTSRLIIRQSRLQDRGIYECRAVNIVQKSPAIAKAIVIVTKPATTKKPTKAPKTMPTMSSLWPTGTCPNSDFCLNGGTCIFYRDVREYVCHCADGFVGLRCDYKDVKASLGGVKSMERDHNRLFVTVILLFIILSCLNWCGLVACWICCFRNEQDKRKMAPLNRLLNYVGKRSEHPSKEEQCPSRSHSFCFTRAVSQAERNDVNHKSGDETEDQNSVKSGHLSATRVEEIT